jgi:prevent-host-death family protein
MRKGYYSHVRRASISEVKNSLSSYVDLVRQGETVVITDRGRPVAQLGPPARSTRAEADERRVALEGRGVLLRARARAGKGFLDRLPTLPKAKAEAQATGDVLEALLEERREGR